MRYAVYHAAWSFDADEPDKRLTVALMKRYVPKAATQVADAALQIFGGRGYTDDERVSWIWQDCRGNQISEGTDEIMTYIAAPMILGDR
jgi:alkylation response protein AidB-like acyl-CoA dehydrogenase